MTEKWKQICALKCIAKGESYSVMIIYKTNRPIYMSLLYNDLSRLEKSFRIRL